MALTETAYAKINLALHVRKRREDGYHELETLFAFVDAGDRLTARRAEEDSLETIGEFAGALDDPFDNLAMRALGKLPRAEGFDLTLEKALPVAAGLGGGSADAGAVFRMVERMHGLPEDWQARAASLGADVPVCVKSETAIGRGTGAEFELGPNDLAGTPLLLVNPRQPLATGPVFAAWDEEDRGALPSGTARQIALGGRNDLEAPAQSLRPEIAEVLGALRETPAWLARMSGSGATCFALFDDESTRDAAAERIAAKHPDWWTMSGALR